MRLVETCGHVGECVISEIIDQFKYIRRYKVIVEYKLLLVVCVFGSCHQLIIEIPNTRHIQIAYMSLQVYTSLHESIGYVRNSIQEVVSF